MENAHRTQGWYGSQLAEFYLGQQVGVGKLPGGDYISNKHNSVKGVTTIAYE